LIERARSQAAQEVNSVFIDLYWKAVPKSTLYDRPANGYYRPTEEAK
jgi:hypothetical protein